MRRLGSKFLADENIPSKAVHRLQKDGIDIIHVSNIKYGLADNHILKMAYKEKRILITFDKEFGYLVFKKKMKSFGIILLRFSPLSPEHVANRINELIKEKIMLLSSTNLKLFNPSRHIPRPDAVKLNPDE